MFLPLLIAGLTSATPGGPLQGVLEEPPGRLVLFGRVVEPPYTFSGADSDTLFLNGHAVAPAGDRPRFPNLKQLRGIARLQADLCAALRAAPDSADLVELTVRLYRQSAFVDSVGVIGDTVWADFAGFRHGVWSVRPSWARSGDSTCWGMTRAYENVWNNDVGFLGSCLNSGGWVLAGDTYLRPVSPTNAQDLLERAPLPGFDMETWNRDHHTSLPEAVATDIRRASEAGD